MSALDGMAQGSDRMPEYQRVASEASLSLRRKTKKLEALTAVLSPVESVLALSAGTADGNVRENLLALTDRRILILKDDPGEAVSLDLGRVVQITAKRGMGSGRIDILLRDMRMKISAAHNDSVVLFARRAEEARRKRMEDELAAAVHPDPSIGPDQANPDLPQNAYATVLPPQDHERLEVAAPDPIEAPRVAPPMQPPPNLPDPQQARIPALRDVVGRDEQVLLFTTGSDADGATLVAVTDHRVIVMEQLSMSEAQTSTFELDGIGSIAGASGSGIGQVRIKYGGTERTISRINADMVQPLVNLVKDLIRQRKPPPPPKPLPAPATASPTQSPVDVADQLEKLASLLERGLLTPEEFAQQKAKLLGS